MAKDVCVICGKELGQGERFFWLKELQGYSCKSCKDDWGKVTTKKIQIIQTISERPWWKFW